MRMPEQERHRFWARLMEFWSDKRTRQTIAITKYEFRDAIHALDDFVEVNWLLIEAAHLAGTLQAWVVANRAAINQAIPEPARSSLTRDQKEWMFRAVVRREATDGA